MVDIILLQNHGVVVSKAFGKDVLELHAEIHETFQNFEAWKTFGMKEDFFPPGDVVLSMRERILFSDPVISIFAQGDIKTLAAKEWFSNLAEGSMLLNMESEEYRQGV